MAIYLIMSNQNLDMVPRLAIIIPVFGHSALVSEALQSALDQKTEFITHIVVVNDGCPNIETDLVLSVISGQHPDRITYLRKANGGLSSARNFAIKYILTYMPSIEAMFMLDADNRLRPQSMARAMATLDKTENADWVYPSIDMFGVKARCDYGGPYSRLIHSEMNICEAGSLIRRAVFESGVMFDETYTLGFEDWHFFLQAGDAGFRGVNLEDFGLLYRKRPESMLANADRNNGLLLGQISQSHPDLFHPVAQAHLEQKEAPRFAIYLPAEDVVLLTTDPDMGTEMTLLDYEHLYWNSQTTPMKYRVPPFLVVTSRTFLDELRVTGLLHWTVWQMEQAAMENGLAFVTHKVPIVSGEVGYQKAVSIKKQDRDAAIFWIMCIDRLKALTKSNTSIEGLPDTLQHDAQMAGQKIILPSSAPAVTQDLYSCVETLQGSRYRAAGLRRWSWRQPSILWRGKEHLILRKWFNKQPTFPRVSTDTYNIGVLVKSVSDILPNVLETILSKENKMARLHLFIMEDTTAKIEENLHNYIHSVSFLDDTEFDHITSRKRQFLGTFLPIPKVPSVNDKAMGMLYWLDELHNLNCPAASRLMGPLRRFGIITTLHFNTYNSKDRSVDTSLALAYEHAYNYLSVPDEGTLDYLCSMGIPASKVNVLGVSDVPKEL
jgi:hypothetical protein